MKLFNQDVLTAPIHTARQYAAIQLCVPDSGDAALDAMIQKARRDKFICAVVGEIASLDLSEEQVVSFVNNLADTFFEEEETV